MESGELGFKLELNCIFAKQYKFFFARIVRNTDSMNTEFGFYINYEVGHVQLMFMTPLSLWSLNFTKLNTSRNAFCQMSWTISLEIG